MWNSFSVEAREAVLRAQDIATRQHSSEIDSAHIFLGVLDRAGEDSVVSTLLMLAGTSLEEAQVYAQSALETLPPREVQDLKLTASAKRILELGADEARQLSSQTIESEHLLLACLRHQRGVHVGEVLRPLGLDPEKLRQHLRGLISSETPYSPGSPLNLLTQNSKSAVEAAHEVMRSSFCGRISTAHVLLGLLADEENVAVETLLAAGIDIEELRKSTRARIVSDGQIATPQKKFTAASKRALERAKKEAERCDHSFIGPQHLLYALLPHAATIAENVSFGNSPDDPLEKVWAALPSAAIQTQYQALWRPVQPRASEFKPMMKETVAWVKVDWRWALAGVFWWMWLLFISITFIPLLGGFLLAMLAAWRGESTRNYVLRDRGASFCYGMLGGIFLLFVLVMIFPIF